MMKLKIGIQGEILACRFDPTGQNIAACSTDRCVSLWKTYAPNTNYGYLANVHRTAITDLQWSLLQPLLYTVSADSTLAFSDLITGTRLKKIRAHKGVINTLDRTIAGVGGGGVELLATAGDDGMVKIWESSEDSTKRAVGSFELPQKCPATSVCWSADGSQVYVASLTNDVDVYDLRANKISSTLTGHTDTPTSLTLSPNGSFLLAPSLSSQTIIFDVRPFSPTPNRFAFTSCHFLIAYPSFRIHRVLQGSPTGFEQPLLRGAW